MDYSKITLIFRERSKLFIMRFFHPVSTKFLGQDRYALEHVYKFVYSTYKFTDTLKNQNSPSSCYYLTDNYKRYRAWKRRQFYDTKVWQLIISIVAAVIASLITNSLLK